MVGWYLILKEGSEMENRIEKLSLSRCKSILENDGSKYSNEEILEIRDFLFKLAGLDYEVFLKQKLRDLEFEEEKRKTEEGNYKQAA